MAELLGGWHKGGEEALFITEYYNQLQCQINLSLLSQPNIYDD